MPVTPDEVLTHVEARLGPVDHDTGWCSLPTITDEEGIGDCLGGRDYRVLWWDDLSIAFWRTENGGSLLWAWSIGDRRVSGWGDRREPYDPPAEATSGLMTETGIGVGASEQAVIETYGERLQRSGTPVGEPDDGTHVYDSSAHDDWPFAEAGASYGVTISVRDGTVTGIGATMRFC